MIICFGLSGFDNTVWVLTRSDANHYSVFQSVDSHCTSFKPVKYNNIRALNVDYSTATGIYKSARVVSHPSFEVSRRVCDYFQAKEANDGYTC